METEEVTETAENQEGCKSELEIAQAALDQEEVYAAIEALLLASGEPLGAERFIEALGITPEQFAEALQVLEKRYDSSAFGMEIKCVAGQYQLRTKNRYAVFIKALSQSKPKKLSGAALETLAIVAYRQPIVKSDIETIRGVDATPTIKTLLDRKLIKIVGHQATVGQPALYGTTEDFMKIFGLSSLEELPSLRDLKELEAEPSEDGEEFANNLKEESLSSEAD